MQRGNGTRAPLTKAAEALPKDFFPSFVPWREETEGHVQAKRRVPTFPPKAVTEPNSEFIDHNL